MNRRPETARTILRGGPVTVAFAMHESTSGNGENDPARRPGDGRVRDA
jgi:hypothetical protein